MVIHDINQNKREVILLIHPMNFSGKMMMDSMAKELGCEYLYIVPDLSGHGEAKDDPYVSTAEEAATLAHYLKEHVFLSKQKKARQDPKPVIDKVAKRYGIYANMLVDTLVTMDKQSIKNIVYDCGHIRLPHLSEDTQQDTIFSYGDKDPNVGHARRSIKKHYPKAKLKIWQGYGHCEEMTQNTEAYMAFVKGCMD